MTTAIALEGKAEHADAGQRHDERRAENQPAPSTSSLSRPNTFEPLKSACRCILLDRAGFDRVQDRCCCHGPPSTHVPAWRGPEAMPNWPGRSIVEKIDRLTGR